MNLFRLKISLLHLFLLSSICSYNQNIAKKFVLDSEVQTTIPFVNIQLKNGTKGWITNANGSFEVNLDLLTESDTVLLSAIGYKKLALSYTQFTDSSILLMLPKTFTLNEVEVKTRSYRKGYLGQKRRASTKGFKTGIRKRDLSKSSEDAIYIPNTLGAEGIIDNINLFVYKGSKTPIKIRLYSHNIIKGSPDNLLLSEPLLVKEEEDRRWLVVNLKNENISIPYGGFYISVDWNVDSIYKEKEDTVIKEIYTSDNKKYYDTIISNGLVLGEAFFKTMNRWRKDDSIGWYNIFQYKHEKLGDFYHEGKKITKMNYQNLAIYTSILYDKANKHYQENIFDKNGIVPDKLTNKILKKKYKKVKSSPAIYPQNDILALLKSIKKAQENNQTAYLLQHLYFYTYEELEDIINQDTDSKIIKLPFIDKLINNIDKLIISEIEQGLYSFEYENSLYGNFQLKNGEWKLSPTFNILEDNQ